MDENTCQLITQVKDRLAQISDGQISVIVREAREVALVEAKAIIKEAMVQSILERALGEFEGSGEMTAPAVAEPRLEVAPAPTGQEVAEDEEQIQKEIEAIKRKITENEKLLSRALAPPQKVEKEPVVGEEAGCAYYVYGVIGSDDGRSPEGLPDQGIDPEYRVYALPGGSNEEPAVQAIVSKVSLQEFGKGALETNLDDVQWLQAKVFAHQRVLETLLGSFTLVPMRFCTIYRSESRVQEMLAQHYDELAGAVADLEGKQEWGVKVYCDGESLAKQVEEVSEKVRELRAEMAFKSSGAAYFIKKKLERSVAEEVERISDEYAQQSHDRLSSHAQKVIINPLQHKGLTGRMEAMILNGAYLLTGEKLGAFRAELDDLGAEYGDLGFGYEMTGPWPPYNFVTVNLSAEGDIPRECVANE